MEFEVLIIINNGGNVEISHQFEAENDDSYSGAVILKPVDMKLLIYHHYLLYYGPTICHIEDEHVEPRMEIGNIYLLVLYFIKVGAG